MQQRGFTITELTVVIIVIGILIAIGGLAASQVQKDARDTKRESDIAIVQNELEKYYETNGIYPPGCSTNCTTSFITNNTATSGVRINGTITQSSLKTILPGLSTNISDPTNSSTNTPFAATATYTKSSQRYFYYGGTINTSTTSSAASNATPTVDGIACTITQSLNASEVGSYAIGYFSEAHKKWILKLGNNGRKPTLATASSHSSCTL